MQQAQLAAQAQHQSAMNGLMQQQKHREAIRGQCLLKLMQFGEYLSGFPVSILFPP